MPHKIVDPSHGEPKNNEARRAVLVFGVDEIRLHRDGSSVPVTVDALNSSGVDGLADVTHLVINIHCSSAHLAPLHRLSLSRLTSLHTLSIQVQYDTDVNDRIITVWRGILAVLQSLPEATRIANVSITSPVPHRVLRVGWASSTLVRDLAQPLYSMDHCLVALVDRAPLQEIVLVAPADEYFTSTERTRVRAFFPALSDYGLLRF
ncbi:hypothetical protein PsYK624_081130 [Phanerochaete sordida]|uniref:Uncharacterized protein n=1 Tax=Phanerochaete sordida TaxID=48140 RepID=A0A9P3LDY0_9APHY|nr:hypothetical protein PsYK624_081130 [Phanerochaete sordida]